MPPRVVVHAGFHKTGTTSIQKALDAHRAVLAPLTIQLGADMRGLCEAARIYSVSRSAFDLGYIRYEAAALAENWQGTLLLSSEDLAGQMPGRRGLTSYDTTPQILAAMTEGFRAARPEIALAFALTTRSAAPWLLSCHMQHLRATRMTLSAEEYAADYAASADLTGVIAKIADALPGIAVHELPLEAETDPLTALLGLVGVPPDKLPAMPHKNRSEPDALRAGLLAINRSDRSDVDARTARKALMRKGRP